VTLKQQIVLIQHHLFAQSIFVCNCKALACIIGPIRESFTAYNFSMLTDEIVNAEVKSNFTLLSLFFAAGASMLVV